MEQKALRYNDGKKRYDLLEPFAIDKLVEVFTFGAKKYEDHNWLKGLKWSNITSSLKRHLAAYEQGEDFDKESELLHIQHVAWNAMALLSHYKYHPQLDDRRHNYLIYKKIGLDIDGVLADFVGGINEILGISDHEPFDWEDPKITTIFEKVKKDPDFWRNLKPLIHPKDIPFQPHCYITSRSIDIQITKDWLHKHEFANVPIYCVGHNESKVEVAKTSGIDYFIDDYINNFIELNNNGICTFLIDRSWNSKLNVGYKRIKDFNDFKERFL